MYIKRDYKWRNFISGHELTDKQKSEFDWLDDIDSETFIKYKRTIYHLGEFTRIDESAKKDFFGFHAYYNFTYFAGLAVKLNDCGDQYQIGYFYT